MDPMATSETGPDHLPPEAVLAAAAALNDDLRRQMYAHIRQARRPVSREEAAKSAGISRKLAAFHLDKLVEVGLLRAHYEPVDRTRKVGRAPKLYEPSNAGLQISIPTRKHDLLAGILLDALLVDDHDKTGVEAAAEVARQRGAELGSAESERARPGRLGAERALTLAAAALSRYGFEPERATPTRLRMRNCPFHPLAGRTPQLVCGINHAFFTGFLDALGASTVTAVLAPRAGECCVELAAD
jgi:predicted ArsR family transcriptional regulator